MRHNKFEFGIWTFAFIFLGWQLIMWFINLVNGFSGLDWLKKVNHASSIKAMNANTFVLDPSNPEITNLAQLNAWGITQLTSNILQLAYLVIIASFAVIWYFVYYAPKLKVRLANNTQTQFDEDFRIKDDWAFVAKNMQSEIENYLDRNVRIHGDNKNANYQFAKSVRKELVSSEGEWCEEEDKDE